MVLVMTMRALRLQSERISNASRAKACSNLHGVCQPLAVTLSGSLACQ